MTTTDVLRQAKELLSDERRWHKGAAAATENGTPVSVGTPSASKWCLVGAVYQVGFGTPLPNIDAVFDALGAVGVPRDGIGQWNDHIATHADLIDAFDRALLLVADPVEENVGEVVAA